MPKIISRPPYTDDSIWHTLYIGNKLLKKSIEEEDIMMRFQLIPANTNNKQSNQSSYHVGIDHHVGIDR